MIIVLLLKLAAIFQFLSIYYYLKIKIFDNSFAVWFLLCKCQLGGVFLAAAATPSIMVLHLDVFWQFNSCLLLRWWWSSIGGGAASAVIFSIIFITTGKSILGQREMDWRRSTGIRNIHSSYNCWACFLCCFLSWTNYFLQKID